MMPYGDIDVIDNVALFTGAWIEIARVVSSGGVIAVALFTGAWIEMTSSSSSFFAAKCRALYGRVD